MTKSFLLILTISFVPVFLNNSYAQSKTDFCECDTAKTKEIIKSKTFNRIAEYDSSSFDRFDFYKLDSSINRMLWYRDVENIDSTKFTRLWDDYSRANYHVSQLDFVKFYKGKKDVEIAFQFGPNTDLWAYHIFIIKKIGYCYVVTRSYFRHARFTYKAYSIIDREKLDTLYSILNKVKTSPVSKRKHGYYCGYFADNRNKKAFFIDFDKEVKKTENSNDEEPRKEVNDLYEFVDKKIKWTKTYSLK